MESALILQVKQTNCINPTQLSYSNDNNKYLTFQLTLFAVVPRSAIAYEPIGTDSFTCTTM